MRGPRVAHTQTRLADGRVLVAGGLRDVRSILPPANNDVEIFDPATRRFSVLARMDAVRVMHTATLLADGRVVLIGGSPGARVDVCSVAAGSVESAGDILQPRGLHTATLLPDGRILIVGGMKEVVTWREGEFHEARSYLKSIEIYDPSGGASGQDPAAKSSRALAMQLAVARRGHTATLLDDGRVLIIGGTGDPRTEIVDAGVGSVAWGPPLVRAREDHRTTRLVDGRLLVTGGSAPGGKSLDVAEIFDPSGAASGQDPKENRFRMLGARMCRAREDHTADLLPDGRVLITGGEDNQAGPDKRDIVLDDVEIFDPKTESFAKLPPLSEPRDEHRSCVLIGGDVLITGGEDENDEGLRTAEIIAVPRETPSKR
jgi:hypothetical protein